MKPGNIQSIVKLTPIQEGMLYHVIDQPRASLYLNQFCARLNGVVDTERFQAAWQNVTTRHTVLRTLFTWDRRDDPLQLVRNQIQVPFFNHDWTVKSDREQQLDLEELLVLDRDRGFDLASAPLFRVRLIKLGEQQHQLVFSFSHLVLDGWSMRSVLNEVMTEYLTGDENSIEALPPVPDYAEYVQWIGHQDIDKAKEFWNAELGEITEPFSLLRQIKSLPNQDRVEHAAKRITAEQVTTEKAIEPTLSTALSDFAKRQQVTLNTLFVAAWGLTLGRYTQCDDVVFGTTFTLRPSNIANIENAVGLFINTLPLRLRLNGTQTLTQLLQDAHQAQARVRPYLHTPLSVAQKSSGVEAQTSLFDSLLVFENFPLVNEQPASLQLSDESYIEFSHYPLALLVIPGETIQLHLIHDTSYCSVYQASEVLTTLAQVLAQFIEAPEQSLNALPLVTNEQRNDLLRLGRGESLAVERDVLLHQRIELQADIQGQNIALAGYSIHGHGDALSYADLDLRANQLAAELLARDCGAYVLIYANRSVEALIAVLAVLKIGAAYVPVDSSTPAKRVTEMLRDLVPNDQGTSPLIFCDVRELDPRHIDLSKCIDLRGDYSHHSSAAPDKCRNSELAYTIYTSGSTGRPKGVSVTHHSLNNSTTARLHYYGHTAPRFLLLSSLATDSSIAGIFWSLCSGGSLVIPEHRAEQDMQLLSELMASNNVTHLLCVPALYRMLLEFASSSALKSLRTVIVAGENCPYEIVNLHYERLPNAELYNEYGPSEATVWTSVAKLERNTNRQVPIGKPIINTQFYIVDHQLRLLPFGAVGELLIAGDNLASGYLHDPMRTQQSFVQLKLSPSERPVRAYRTGDRVRWSESGALEFTGRVDDQIKIRGFRIEPDEIEAVVRQHPDIDDVAAYRHPVFGQLWAMIKVAQSRKPSPQLYHSLEQLVRKYLPVHMVPTRFVSSDVLPRTGAGKINRRELINPAAPWNQLQHDNLEHTKSTIETTPASDQSMNQIERTLHGIWQEVLQIENIGVNDNFFELGGDSLLSIRVLARAGKASIRIRPDDFLSHPTIAGQASAAVASSVVVAETGQVRGKHPLLPIQRWFLNSIQQHPQQWNQSKLFKLNRKISRAVFSRAVQRVLQHHDALRSRVYRSTELSPSVQIEVAELPAELPITWLDTSKLSETESLDVLESCALDFNRGMSLERSPLLQVAYVTTAEESPDYLLVVAHHMIVDAESWRIIMEDLTTLCASDDAFELPAKTSSCKLWAKRLSDYSQSTQTQALKKYYQVMPTAVSTRDHGTEADVVVVEHVCRASFFTSWMGQIPSLYRCAIYDAIVAAFATSLHRTLATEVCFDVEGHGRHSVFDDIDVSRTVGWLTTMHPLLYPQLDQSAWDEHADIIRITRELLASAPMHGLGYGLLAEQEQWPARQALFNFMGNESAALEQNSLITVMAPIFGEARHPQCNRPYALEVNASVIEGQLCSQWRGSGERFTQPRLRQLIDVFDNVLHMQIEHSDAQGKSLIIDDFPLSGLNQDELDALASQVGDLDEN